MENMLDLVVTQEGVNWVYVKKLKNFENLFAYSKSIDKYSNKHICWTYKSLEERICKLRFILVWPNPRWPTFSSQAPLKISNPLSSSSFNRVLENNYNPISLAGHLCSVHKSLTEILPLIHRKDTTFIMKD